MEHTNPQQENVQQQHAGSGGGALTTKGIVLIVIVLVLIGIYFLTRNTDDTDLRDIAPTVQQAQ